VGTGPNAIALTGAYLAAAPRTGYSVQGGVQSHVETTLLLLFRERRRRASAAGEQRRDRRHLLGRGARHARSAGSVGDRRTRRGTLERERRHDHDHLADRRTQTLARAGNDLRERYVTWSPYPSVDGLRLAARYQHVPPFGQPWGVTLRADGTFQEDGVNEIMGGTDINPGFPEHGAGRTTSRAGV